jgi:hypothetical protein
METTMTHENAEPVEGGGPVASSRPVPAPSGDQAANVRTEGAARPSPPPGEDPDAREWDEREREDWRWLFRGRETGLFDQYRGRHIAIVGKKVVGSDDDPLQLRAAVAAALHMHPERVVVAYVDDP